MTRLPLTFECQGETCGATLDNAARETGLLIVSGGNEIRAGAFNGQAILAAEISAAGFPVFRYDRRGIGDSAGDNRGFRKSRKDIAAALAAFRAIAPGVRRVVGFGNCDAASALMLAGGADCDALVLSNPWTIDEGEVDAGRHASSTVRARYAGKLKNPKELGRLIRGQVNLGKLARGLVQAARPAGGPSSLVQDMQEAMAGYAGPVQILLAEADRTAQMFLERWDRGDPRIRVCRGADHAYSGHRDWLRGQLIEALQANG